MLSEQKLNSKILTIPVNVCYRGKGKPEISEEHNYLKILFDYQLQIVFETFLYNCTEYTENIQHVHRL